MATVAVVFLLAACKDTGDASPPVSGATVPTLGATTTTTNPYTVPAVIDAAYVNRVLEGLDALEGDTLRTVKSTKMITPETVDRVKAFHANLKPAEVLLNLYQFDLARGFSDYLPQIGNVRTIVSQLITTRQSCIYAKVDRDYSAQAASPNPADRTQWVAIRPVAPSQSNPTGWGYEYNGFESNRQAPRVDPCSTF